MAEYSIISDISNSLLKLLRDYICPEPVQSPESIKLISPSDKNADYQVGLHLYDIKEFSEYRTSVPTRDVHNQKIYPPKPLTLSYMLFLNGKAQIAAGAEAEQRIIGRATQILMDHPFIDIAEAHASLEQSEDDATITLLNQSFEEKSKIWSVLTQPYQISIQFTVSPVMLSSRRKTPFTRVSSTEIGLEQKEVR